MREPTRVTFLTEQHVGLKTYSENLRRFIDRDGRIEPTWVPITYESSQAWWERISLLPESVRGALRGRAQVRSALRRTRPAATFYLTQVPASLGGRRVRRHPYVVMADDTPRLFHEMAHHYELDVRDVGAVAWVKERINRTALRGASFVLPMSRWGRASLIEDYGVDERRIRVVPTGIDLELWRPAPDVHSGPLRVLFVGGDFQRKGGDVLLAAVANLAPGTIELHVVTRSDVALPDGVQVHHGLEPNSPELVALFQACDVFVLPSRGEAYPNVVMEACASGLPCVVTGVGAMPEMIVAGESGFVVAPDDSEAIAHVLELLVGDPDRLASMSEAARSRAEECFDGRANATLVVDLILESVGDA